MLGYNKRSFGFEDMSKIANVPNDDMAKLMYYLNCVNSLTDFGISQRLRNFQNYRSLSCEEENDVLCLAIILSPDEFVKRKVMIPVTKLEGNSSNKFYKITDSRISFAATEEFFIGGKHVHTLKIMLFKISWLEKNYSEPIKNYSSRIYDILHPERKRPRTVQYTRITSSDESSACTIC